MNFILLSEAVEEVVEETTSTGISLTDSQLKLVLLAVAVIGIAIYFILRPTPEKTEQAKKFLNSLATQIMNIVYANIEYKIETYNGTIDLSFDEFKEKIVNVVYTESWSFVEKAVKDAVEAGKLDPIAAKFIKEESVKSLVDVVVGRDTIQKKFVEAFNKIFDMYNEQQLHDEEEDKAFVDQMEAEPLEEPEPIKDEQVEAFVGNSEADNEPDEITQDDIEEVIAVSDEEPNVNIDSNPIE